MNTLPLEIRDGHFFVLLGDELWLLDTGAPVSFGRSSHLTIAGEEFNVGSSYLGLSPEALSGFIGTECFGLLGANILGQFDHIFDAISSKLIISTTILSHRGRIVRLDGFMGIPILIAQICGRDFRTFLDTGAQFSYFQDELLTSFRPAGIVNDFYPGFGQFQVDTYEVPVSISEIAFTLRCGMLPDILATTLGMARAEGLIGNEILLNRIVGYFPRRKELVI